MNIKTITFTGADDSTDPKWLAALSTLHPSVEWGILFSRAHQGAARYPSPVWIDKLEAVKIANPRLRLSAHLCGAYVREICRGRFTEPPGWGMFDRVQLNFHGIKHDIVGSGFTEVLEEILSDGKKVIFQMDGTNDGIFEKARVVVGPERIFPFFDCSHGAGVVPDTWPCPIDGVMCGYAGGLGPDNLAAECERISEVVGNRDIWVDMETKVRSANGQMFDLRKIETCLQITDMYGEERRCMTP